MTVPHTDAHEKDAPEELVPDPHKLVERAMQNVLGQLPELPDDNERDDPSMKLQPWAEKAAPTGKNKKSMETLIEEFKERLQDHPMEQVRLPEPPHTTSFYDRFAARVGRKRNRKRRPGEGGGQRQQQGSPGPRAEGQRPQGQQGQRPPGSGGGRRRRPRRGPRPE